MTTAREQRPRSRGLLALPAISLVLGILTVAATALPFQSWAGEHMGMPSQQTWTYTLPLVLSMTGMGLGIVACIERVPRGPLAVIGIILSATPFLLIAAIVLPGILMAVTGWDPWA